MILKLKRIEYNANSQEAKYNLLNKDDSIINEIHCEFKNESHIFDINYNGNKTTLNVPKFFKDKSVIYEGNKVEGYIECKESKKVIDLDYSWTMKYKDREFDLYEIGYGHSGIYFVIKENDKTVAIISKELITKSFKDSYEIFVENDTYAIIAIISCLYWNIYRGTNFVKNGASGTNTINDTLTTLSGKLKEKMDFEFIERIAKQENYTINNKKEDAKRNSTLGWILLLLCTLIIIIMAL